MWRRALIYVEFQEDDARYSIGEYDARRSLWFCWMRRCIYMGVVVNRAFAMLGALAWQAKTLIIKIFFCGVRGRSHGVLPGISLTCVCVHALSALSLFPSLVVIAGYTSTSASSTSLLPFIKHFDCNDHLKQSNFDSRIISRIFQIKELGTMYIYLDGLLF